MDGNKLKEGVSVKEIENFTKNHRFEVFFCVLFLFACFFSFIMWGAWWTILSATAGGILGVLMPARMGLISHKMFHFVFKQEKTTQLVLAIVAWILAIFIPPLVFLLMGVHGGKDLHKMTKEIGPQEKM